MLNPMTWLRSAAKVAVPNGVIDGLAEVVPADRAPADLAALRARRKARA